VKRLSTEGGRLLEKKLGHIWVGKILTFFMERDLGKGTLG